MKADSKYKIAIGENNLVMDIQGAFTAMYPFLKIEFFGPDTHSRLLRSAMIEPRTALKKLAKIAADQIINISRTRSVSEVAHDIEHTLGVIVQMSRRSGNVWSLISITDGWTLESQNTAGEFISAEMAGTYS